METLPTTTAPDPVPIPTESPQLKTGWGPVARTAFRIAFVYFLLYGFAPAYSFPLSFARTVYTRVGGGLPTSAGDTPAVLTALNYPLQWYGEATNWLTPRVCRTLRGVETEPPTQFTGAGDGLFQYCRCFTFLVVAVSVGLVWTVASELWMRLRTRRRPSYDRLNALFRLVLRLHLMTTLVGYGLAKVWCSQFPPITDGQLEVKYGDSSPMGLLWRFMQFSQPYTSATGVIELVCGLLLICRRTTLLGALCGGGAMLQVFLLNMCYDVPVKLMSGHMVLIALALIVPDHRRLLAFFWLARPADPPTLPALFAGWPWIHRVGLAVRTLAYVGYAVLGLEQQYTEAKRSGILAPPDTRPYVGRWVGLEFERDGKDVPFPEQPENPPPTQFTPSKWAGEAGMQAVIRVSVQPQFQSAAFVFADKTLVSYPFRAEADDTELVLTRPQQPEPIGRLKMSFPEPDRMVLEGSFGQQQVKMTLRRIVEGKKEYELKKAEYRFRWVQERPFNR